MKCGYEQDWVPVNAGRGAHYSKAHDPKAHNPKVHSKDMDKDADADELPRLKIGSLEVGKAIEQARIAKKFTQKDLAKAVNKDVQLIQQIESGKVPLDNSLKMKLQKKLGCKLPSVTSK
jgi:ribosome-binding protein aMBF1 (putative translation factor)